MVSESVATLFFLGFLGFILNYFAWRKKFYIWSNYPVIPLELKHLVCVFAIYIGVTFFLPHYFIAILKTALTFPLLLTLQFILILTTIIGILLYCKSQAPHLFSQVLKNKASPSSRLYDWSLGFFTWILAFPVAAFVSQFFDLLLYLIYKLENYEQVAVRYLKTSLQSPSLQTLALLSIVLLAPVIEEFLFRGTLQSYIKKWLGAKAAIILSATCFALFHFSSEQGLGNLSLIPSLFTFGCFLGYIYERQGSLYASIGLHMAFNLINSLRILFSEGVT